MPPRISWLNEHVETFLDTLLAQKPGFGQGGNPQTKHIQAAVDAVNSKFSGTQNTPKLLRSAQDKWRTLKSIYSGLMAWDSRSGLNYDDEEYGCGVDTATQAQWQAHIAVYKNVTPFANTPWRWWSTMREICGSEVLVKGKHVFSAQSRTGTSTQDSVLPEDADEAIGESQASDDKEPATTETEKEKEKEGVDYSSDEDVLITSSQKVPATPGQIQAKRPASDDTPSLSQRKKGRTSGVDALVEANKRMDRVGDILEKGFQVLTASSAVPAPPQTPTRHERSVIPDSSPVRARNAASAAARLEMEHLQDPMQVTKFLCYLEKNPAAVITYNTLTTPGMEELRKAYVKQCLQIYEEGMGM